MKTWYLFVDESGAFGTKAYDEDEAAPSRGAVVVGTLFPPGVSGAALDDAFERVAPGFPRPLHATSLRRPALHAARAAAFGDTYRALGRAAALLRAQAPTELSQMVECFQQRRAPTASSVRDLDQILGRADPALRGELSRTVVRRTLTDLRGLLRSLAKEGVRLFLAAEARRADSVPAPFADRYLGLLACLFERARLAVERQLPGHERGDVNLVVGGRKVHHEGATDFLSPRIVRLAADWSACHGDRVRLHACPPRGMDGRAPPGLEVADLTANASFQVTDDRAIESLGLDQLVQRLRVETELPLDFGAGTGPHVATSGTPREHLARSMTQLRELRAAGFRPFPVERVPRGPGLRPWAADQSDRWLELEEHLWI